ncbi:hypothetical protein BU24DRAFT_421229 [Aaosphaeria arxii CBS 175.79]|uniref:Uncharacterized protein n=1 Tax=Aaosphaeria arxii CBS 175.79 TaxID=1450172 RepID=A0A6A5XYZ7_9PLEO|nr:uncharacterized protein BU24DRAFT_421229 [Aaosphaeria arxii CBS 175.79]KAF2018216.1 hypothetical protein BU24DRAFT_421229 [Aaosphaeria arxii CBS 175.79]
MASTRLRRTFHYPSDSEDNDAVEAGMDLQDQETLITTLSARDTSSTKLYTQILLLLPLAPIALYIPRLFGVATIIPSLLAIASLLASAYTLYFLPLPPATSSNTSPTATAANKPKIYGSHARKDATIPVFLTAPQSKEVPYVSPDTAEYLRRYAIPVNAALCAAWAVAEALLGGGRSWREGMMIGGGYVPGFVLAVVLWARRELRVVDMGELERVRYAGKGS